MFTGLVACKGRVAFVRRSGGGMDLGVEISGLEGVLEIGESVALSGCCATVTRLSGRRAEFHLTRETLARTWFGDLAAGRELNLERALRPTDRFGGHIVQGHVDATGEVLGLEARPDGTDLFLSLPPEVRPYCVVKGSIAVDGVSLTLAGVEEDRGRIALIPHTMAVTTLGSLKPGDPVHLEADVLAKYVEGLLKGPAWPA